MNAEKTKRRFKRVDPIADARLAEDRERELHGNVYSLFKEGVSPFVFEDRRYFLRLLPQPMDAINSWSLTLPYIYLDPNQTPGHRGYLALTIPQATVVDHVRRALYSHTSFAPLMASKENRTGISLSLKYRSLFMGFSLDDPTPAVMPVALPSNGFTRPSGESRLLAGTAINSFLWERDSAGNLKYGDIVDLETGRLICIEVVGQATGHREFVASVDRPYPLDARHEHLLYQTQKFEDVVAYQSTKTLYEILRLRLRPEMWAYVDAKLRLAATFNATAEDEDVAEPRGPIGNDQNSALS